MKEIFKALADFQQECPIIHKGTKGYGYTYADLPSILPIINPILKKHGLGFTQLVNGKSLTTIIFHSKSGETLTSKSKMPIDDLQYIEAKNKKGEDIHKILGFDGMNKAQAIGSLITYFRRYALSSALGIITDKDTDGRGTKEEPTIKKNELSKEMIASVIKWAGENNLGIADMGTYYTMTKEVKDELTKNWK